MELHLLNSRIYKFEQMEQKYLFKKYDSSKTVSYVLSKLYLTRKLKLQLFIKT